MTFDQSIMLLNALVLVGSVIVNVYLYVKGRSDKRFETFATQLGDIQGAVSLETAERKAFHADLDKRCSLAELKITGMPTHEHIDEIQSAIARISENVATVQERSKIQLDAVRRIESHLLSKS